MSKIIDTSLAPKKLEPHIVAEAFGAKAAQKVIIASKNPVKIAVAEEAFRLVFPEGNFYFLAVDMGSGVSSQPFGEQTRQGARNRLEGIQRAHPDAHYFVSQEGGLFNEGEAMYNRAWIIVADSAGHRGESSSSSVMQVTCIMVQRTLNTMGAVSNSLPTDSLTARVTISHR
jgi:non-canonical (house-cleaning) NTP pyrophosphatase